MFEYRTAVFLSTHWTPHHHSLSGSALCYRDDCWLLSLDDLDRPRSFHTFHTFEKSSRKSRDHLFLDPQTTCTRFVLLVLSNKPCSPCLGIQHNRRGYLQANNPKAYGSAIPTSNAPDLCNAKPKSPSPEHGLNPKTLCTDSYLLCI